ncbi:thiol reductant ABC exporter subunit CydC [Halomonas sp. HP20-15]|uniref:thiol reductant ABC exporter subunit CydC n=1 Tax=Halomonas sp. HP20-15 TaxID=3085901 RepID=UPI002980C30F|nr:thiol reductant ABC exporter subunit CydC [Halomonas sp. HP20-15]MDW5375656.1 thiol reductant ABC exporter subunit CydC [Halomonas sp. HP20-15]
MTPSSEPSLRDDFAPWLRRLGRRRWRLGAGALLMALTVAAGIGLLALSGWFITATAVTGVLLAAGAAATLDVYVPGAGIRLFAVTRTVARYCERLYNHDTVLRVLAELRAGMFSVLTRLDGRTLSQLRASEWLNRLTADIDTLDGLYLRLLAPPLVAALAIGGVGALLACFVPGIALAVMIPLGALWLWLVVGQAWLGMAPARRRVASQDRLRGRVIEQIQGLSELRCYGTLASHRQALIDEQTTLYADQRRLASRQALGNALANLVVGLCVVLALWLAAHAEVAGRISGAVMVMMPLAVLALNEALGGLPQAFTQLGATRAAARRLNELAGRQSALREAEAPFDAPAGTPAVALDAVSVRYPGALALALDALTLRLDPGERLAVLGASGAGKSTLGQLLVRQIDPSAGRITLNGVDLRDMPLSALRARTGYLTQHSELFQASLADNLRLADPDANEAALWRALDVVDLADWAQALPEGLDTWVGESGRQVSGGQARRIALARVLLKEPELVVLDEPFSGLDASTAARIAERLDRWLEGRSVVFLAHADEGLPGTTKAIELIAGRASE